ncbi:WD repeat-containing protein 55 homolog [Lycorma delicatula]|uniref:WD repeat-containing protein 55 homolog n=1 Tax=Lycorma delicatula TaxID=130591 RepID=UPI003F517AC4
MCNIKFRDENLLPNGNELEDEDDEEEHGGSSEDTSQGYNDWDETSDFSDTGGDNDQDEDENEQAIGGNEDDDDDDDDDIEDEEREDDDLLAAIKLVRMRSQRETSLHIDCEDLTVDISFHPKTNVLAAATITGDLILYKYDVDNVTVCDKLEVHTKACRAVEYSDDGDLLFSASKDRSIMISDSRTGKLKEFYDKAHEGALYCLTIISEHVFASGDEDGVIKLWDVRHKDPIFSVSGKVKDYISGMVTTDSKRYLACTSGEGTITTINLPARKFHVQSEVYESEYTCAGLCRDESKLVAGTANGKLVFYNWGEFGLHSDVYPGPSKKAINCLVSISDNIVITGWEDGQIRATYLFPNRGLGIVGQHQLSVDALDISHDGKYIASCSLDQKINFWPISFFNDIDFSDVLNDQTNLPSSQYADRRTFFADLE